MEFEATMQHRSLWALTALASALAATWSHAEETAELGTVVVTGRREASRLEDTPQRIEVLRIWPAPVRLDNGTPLWVARYDSMQLRRRLRLLNLWKPEPPAHALPADLKTLETDAGLQVLAHPR